MLFHLFGLLNNIEEKVSIGGWGFPEFMRFYLVLQ